LVKIRCKVCGDKHEYSVKNFPLAFTAKRMQYHTGFLTKEYIQSMTKILGNKQAVKTHLMGLEVKIPEALIDQALGKNY
jgi:hypothetical protein